MQVSREWSSFDTIGGVIIVGIIALIALPTYTDSEPGPLPTPLQSRLHTIRSQIELYNVQNPETPYDATTPAGPAFWDPLVRGNYLQMAPKNPLQANSSLVVATPMEGAGWVWAERSWPLPPEFVGKFTIYAIDENGNFFDWDEDD